MSPNEAVLNFQQFLSAGYHWWRFAAESVVGQERVTMDDAFDDWAQANWELLVERPLCGTLEFLEVYGAGSDYEGAHYSRVFFQAAQPTHEIGCETEGDAAIDVLSGKPVALAHCSFERLTARKDRWYADVPPFDHVLLGDHENYLVALAQVRFFVRPRRGGEPVVAEGGASPTAGPHGR